MAEYYWTAEDYSVNDIPSDAFSAIGAVNSFQIEESGGRKRMRIDFGSSRALLKYILSDAESQPDVEVWVKYLIGNPWAFETMMRATNTATSSETQISVRDNQNDNDIRVYEWVSGSASLLASSSPGIPNLQINESRLRANGTDLKYRWWQEGNAEPSVWEIETETSVNQSGNAGISNFNTTNSILVYEFGVGTNGDPAPTGPVDPGGDEAGDITSAASSTDSWAAQVQSAVSLTSTAAASDQASAIASVNLSIMEAAQATDVTGDAPAAVGSMTDAATGNDTVDALASAAAAVSAGAAAGESWTVQAQVLVNLVEQGAAADEIRRQTESAVTAALEAQSLASDQFIAALDTIASLSDSASVTDAYQAVVLQLASIASGAVASDSFRMLFGLQRAIQEAALADASFSISYAFVNALRSGGLSGDAWALMANLNASLSDVCSVADLMSVRASTTARLTAGAIASSSFAIVNAGVRYLVMGAVILRDALQYRVNTKPALNQSVKIKPGH